MAYARREYVDAATGVPVPGPGPGAVPSGRWITRLRPAKGKPLVSVDVDPEELGPPELQKVDLPRAELLARSLETAEEQRRIDAPDVKAKRRKGKQRVRGVGETFRTAGKAAREFIAANHTFFDALEGLDLGDTVRDWMDGIEIKRGPGWRKLNATTKGQAILRAFYDPGPAGEPWPMLLTWLFSQARTKRWDAVDWSLVEELERRIRGSPEAEGRAIPAVGWRPPGAAVPELALAQMTEAQADEAARVINQQRLTDAAEAMRDAYKAARRCLDKSQRKAARERVKVVEGLAEHPSRVARLVLCVPEGTTRVCGLPVLDSEIERLRAACDRGYDPAWPVSEAAAALARGDPDFDMWPWGTQLAAERRNPKREQLSMWTEQEAGWRLVPPEPAPPKPPKREQLTLPEPKPAKKKKKREKKPPLRWEWDKRYGWHYGIAEPGWPSSTTYTHRIKVEPPIEHRGKSHYVVMGPGLWDTADDLRAAKRRAERHWQSMENPGKRKLWFVEWRMEYRRGLLGMVWGTSPDDAAKEIARYHFGHEKGALRLCKMAPERGRKFGLYEITLREARGFEFAIGAKDQDARAALVEHPDAGILFCWDRVGGTGGDHPEIKWSRKNPARRGAKRSKRKRPSKAGKPAPRKTRSNPKTPKLDDLGVVVQVGKVRDLIVENERGEQQRYKWKAPHPMLVWSPRQRALVWVEGTKPSRLKKGAPAGDGARRVFENFAEGKAASEHRTLDVPAKRLRRIGRAVRITYTEPWGRAAKGTQWYHDFSPSDAFYQAGRQAPFAFAISGPRLALTERGIVY